MQGDQEWHESRIGVITASRFREVMRDSRTKSVRYGKGRETVMCELIAQVITREVSDLSMPAMEHGHEFEPVARREYELLKMEEIVEVNLTISGIHSRIGASPDGLIVGGNNGIEIKCPHTKKHIWTMRNGMPPEHMPQVQGNIWVHEAEWWDFISYDPHMPPDKRLYIQRIERNDDYIKKMSEDVISFADELDGAINEIFGVF